MSAVTNYTESELYEAYLEDDLMVFLEEAFAIIEPGRQLMQSWHLEHLAWLLGEVASGRERRVIVAVPPRSLKSILIAVVFPAFLLGRDPGLKIIVASNTRELARKHAADFRRLTQSPIYKRIFPRYVLSPAGDRVFEQKTTLNGHRIGTSVGATITGQGADMIIIDDPNRAKDIYSEAHRNKVNAYYDQELFTRLNDKKRGQIIVVMQRLHQDDLVGHILERGTWTVSQIPVKATEPKSFRMGRRADQLFHRSTGDILLPGIYDEDVLNDIRVTTGSINFEAQYQQNPTPADGQVIKRSWLHYFDKRPDEFEFVMVSWDLASTIAEDSDYSVGTVWGRIDRDFYLLDVLRDRWESPDLRRLIEDTHFRYNAHATVIEKAGIGDAVGAEMRRQSRIRPILIPVTKDKQARLIAHAPKFEAGQVWIPSEASWLGNYVGELLAFPSGRNDDQVDSTSQALAYLTRHMPRAEKAPTQSRPNPTRPRGTPRSPPRER
ncbi:MAG: phage uncharacterized protein [Devosia sp.]|nr:phage uncharacterized protein [Devosia sp.]